MSTVINLNERRHRTNAADLKLKRDFIAFIDESEDMFKACANNAVSVDVFETHRRMLVELDLLRILLADRVSMHDVGFLLEGLGRYVQQCAEAVERKKVMA